MSSIKRSRGIKKEICVLDGNVGSSKNPVPLPDMPETDPLSIVLSQQKSIIDKYALDKQKLKVKMEMDLESLWNNYKTYKKSRKTKSGKLCSQDAIMPNALMRCFICDTSLRPACEHMCLCTQCDNKPQKCPYCPVFDGSRRIS